MNISEKTEFYNTVYVDNCIIRKFIYSLIFFDVLPVNVNHRTLEIYLEEKKKNITIS